MMRSTKNIIARVITGSEFWISIVAGFLLLLCEGNKAYLDVLLGRAPRESVDGIAMFFQSFLYGYFLYAAPVLCAYPVSSLVCDSRIDGFWQRQEIAVGRKQANLSLWFAGTFCGGLVLLCSSQCFGVISSLVYPFRSIERTIPGFIFWEILVNSHGELAAIALQGFLAFLFGAVWSGVCLLIVNHSPNRYLGTLIPFVLCLALTIVLPSALQPFEMLVQLTWATFSIKGIIIYQLIVYMAVFIVYTRKHKRRKFHE